MSGYNEFIKLVKINPAFKDVVLAYVGGSSSVDQCNIECKCHFDYTGKLKKIEARQITEYKAIFNVEGGGDVNECK